MAKNAKKTPAASKARAGSGQKKAAGKPKKANGSKRSTAVAVRRERPKSAKSPVEALIGLLESPLVADILAAGAAAALAAIAQQGISKKSGSKKALKAAATAAAAAIGDRLVEEFHEIMDVGKKT